MFKLYDIKLSNPLSNASGVLCYSYNDLNTMLNSNSAFMITKSCTLYPRDGNEEPRFWSNNEISINSMGLPNMGFRYYMNWIKDNYHKKPIILSIANINNNETSRLLNMIYSLDYIHLPEINVSCPNIVGKPQLAYDMDSLNYFLSKIMTIYYANKPYGLKLPPFFDPVHIEQISLIIEKYPMIKYITCCNSVGNTLILNENNQPVIKPKDGLGGLGGTYMKPIGLSNVYQFKKRLPNIDIIGCGGIQTKKDVEEYLSVGASCVQIGTALWNDGIGIFDKLN